MLGKYHPNVFFFYLFHYQAQQLVWVITLDLKQLLEMKVEEVFSP